MAYTPSCNNTPGTSSSGATHETNASGVVPNNNSNNGAGNNLQAQRCTPTIPAPNAPKAATRVVFGIQGMRRSLEIEQIEICSQMNDQRFFRELNSRYKKHRWSFQRLLSPFQFQYCNFVKFEKLNVNRVFSFGEGLPDSNGFADDYDYNPKPPQGKIPLIEPGLFAVCLQSCEDDCKWSLLGPWLHDCFQLPPLCDKITCIPKKKSEFPVQCKQILKDTAWGIEAEYTLSFWMLCVYHLIPLLSSFAFWIYWLTKSPGDWQNASVPTITTIALFAFVWVPFGFVFNSHKPVRYC
ncbi:hypothetical protein yc1106_06940 [Curvularia clavata]|uniref:Uncharacterized protein n=1 Tax=Curvularia clavata TaxID=95742 RepID=A0A9Q8ZCH5_CURCL|nr:hypothetical protein yc1106_06940 [Curvularia clavata]